MCGIAGIAGFHAVTNECRLRLDRMMDALRHRGPDDSGTYLTVDVALGHRRLAIVDLTSGRQPIANETGRIRVITNGEIYNYRELREELIGRGHHFNTQSDAEVIVHLYEEMGERFVERLNGMFAIALWDDRRRRLVLVRDRLGVKPLYYAVDGDRLVFASELKAVLLGMRQSATLDPAAIADFLAYGFIPSPKTIFSNVQKLEPGRMLTFDREELRLRRYWDLSYRGVSDEVGEDELAEETWRSLKHATRMRLNADVPVGAFLSGGVDSGAVVGAMAQTARGRITTVTCGFDERDHDERALARQLAERLNTAHVEPIARSNLAVMAERLAWHFDEPFADASAIPMFLISEQAKQYVSVALSGDGGDEVMAGYRRYRFDVAEEAARQWLPSALRRGMLPAIARAWPSGPGVPRFLRAGATLRNISLDPATAHGRSVSTLSPEGVAALMSGDLVNDLRGYDPLHTVRKLYESCDAPDHLSRCQYVDIRLGLADGILTKVDRASMAHALEVRSPMLDYEWVEFAWTIPPQLRRRGRHGKMPLRHAVGRHVDADLAGRVKSGFDVPMDAWFRQAGAIPLVRQVLKGDGIGAWLSVGAMRGVWEAHCSGRANHGATLWKLVVLDSWVRRFGEWIGGNRQQQEQFAA